MNNSETTDPIVDAVMDRAAVLERFEGDMELVREVAELFVADCPHRLNAMHEALTAGDAAALQRAAHSLKGSVSNFSAADAVDAARRLETMGRDGDLANAPAACVALEREIALLLPALIRLTQVDEAVGDHAHLGH